MHADMVRIWVPVPTHAQNSDRCGGKRNTSPWMYFHPVSSVSSAARKYSITLHDIILKSSINYGQQQ